MAREIFYYSFAQKNIVFLFFKKEEKKKKTKLVKFIDFLL